MKKVQPSLILKTFEHTLVEIVDLNAFVEAADALADVSLSESLIRFTVKDIRRLLAEQSLLFVAVAWETFLSDLFMCYINLDCSVYKKDLENRFKSSVTDKLGQELSAQVVLQLSKHLTKAQIASSLDPSGKNFTFKRANTLPERASTHLADRYAMLFNISDEDAAMVDAWIGMRNYLSHRSPQSWAQMREALSSTNLQVDLRWRKRSKLDLGAYLMTRKGTEQAHRILIFMDELRYLAIKLASPPATAQKKRTNSTATN